MFLSQLPVSSSGTDCQDSTSDSEDEDEEISKMTSMPVSTGSFRNPMIAALKLASTAALVLTPQCFPPYSHSALF